MNLLPVHNNAIQVNDLLDFINDRKRFYPEQSEIHQELKEIYAYLCTCVIATYPVKIIHGEYNHVKQN